MSGEHDQQATAGAAGSSALPSRRGSPTPSCAVAVDALNSVVPVEAIERLCTTFQRSARRWEMIIYPSVIMLILMIGGAFFFIYKLTSEMRGLAVQMQPEMGLHLNKVAESVGQLSTSLDRMSRNIDTMRIRIEAMSTDVGKISKQMVYMENLQTMNQQMAQMNQAIYIMTAHTNSMRWNMQTMNNSIARPMSMMNSFMPW